MIYCELTVCLAGKLEYRVDNNPVTLCDGDIIFITEGQMRSRNGSNDYADYVSFNFRCSSPIETGTYFAKALDKEIRLLLTKVLPSADLTQMSHLHCRGYSTNCTTMRRARATATLPWQ